MFTSVVKRDGRVTPYDVSKIAGAIFKAMEAEDSADRAMSYHLASLVEQRVFKKFGSSNPNIENIQDAVEAVLMEQGYPDVSKRYILYRAERTGQRERKTHLMKIYDEITFADSKTSDMKRDNANIDGDTAMGAMLKYGSEGAKDYYEKFILPTEQSRAHRDGDIHIHDMDFYTLTTTCCQIDLKTLFKDGFSTGHGFLREPNDIQSYAALACIAIQSNQNDQHGGQSVPNFDYSLAMGVTKTYRKLYGQNFSKATLLLYPEIVLTSEQIRDLIKSIRTDSGKYPTLAGDADYDKLEAALFAKYMPADMYKRIKDFSVVTTEKETDRATYQAMEALIHNLNTMHSRAGAQTPFSSINYGTDTTPEGRMVIKNIMLANEAGLGFGETPIFPIHIFKVKEGINYNPTDPNYDLFQLACRVSAKRLFPNFSFIDAPFNKVYYKEGRPETEISYMGCRTRVIGNVYDPDNEITYGRGNLSFTSINLPRLAIKSEGNIDVFFKELDDMLALVARQLTDRFAIQSKKKVRNFPFLMGQGVWINSKNLKPDDEIGEILKNGTLSAGFIGLAEALVALTGKHHGESEESQKLGLRIVKYMRDYMDNLSRERKLNYTLIATPAEGLSGRFVAIDRKRFGSIDGVTNREYYTNSFHVPVYHKLSAIDKIKLEAPYHALTNAGHITYVELDGEAATNLEAFETIVRAMKESGVGYGSINHPVDSDPQCGYTGIIHDTCPQCGRTESVTAPFSRIRRITGYLVGTLDRFNNAKRAEERDRVKHNV